MLQRFGFDQSTGFTKGFPVPGLGTTDGTTVSSLALLNVKDT